MRLQQHLGYAGAATEVAVNLERSVGSLEKTLMLGGIGGRRRRGQQRIRWLDGITDSMDVRVGIQRKLSTEELMLLNYGVRENS